MTVFKNCPLASAQHQRQQKLVHVLEGFPSIYIIADVLIAGEGVTQEEAIMSRRSARLVDLCSRKRERVRPQVSEEMISPVEDEFPICNSNTFDAEEECSKIKLLMSILYGILVIFTVGLPFLIIAMSMYGAELHFKTPCFKDMHEDNFKLKWKDLPEAEFLPNVALASLGARIITGRTSASYEWIKPSLFNFLQTRKLVSPGVVIQGSSNLLPGSCWSFTGQQGHITIFLSHKVPISHVTLGHILKSVSPSGTTSSAPKEFSVYGKKTLEDEGTLLGTFMYDNDGDQFQTFKIEDHNEDLFSFVTLKVNSNWGEPKYTCLYNFRTVVPLSRVAGGVRPNKTDTATKILFVQGEQNSKPHTCSVVPIIEDK
ncbi:sperm-associated antigen 4 protein-like [Melanotaenia boesemani]|uniref:sperm-associated antigen 4 protein-like n=1 Tax=Melanotaenia boesemani TaxID=1250792 RepID=UPI001C045136|nr:sperm-associated antigen 4 protein-like [Melanotaenia boesemani]